MGSRSERAAASAKSVGAAWGRADARVPGSARLGRDRPPRRPSCSPRRARARGARRGERDILVGTHHKTGPSCWPRCSSTPRRGAHHRRAAPQGQPLGVCGALRRARRACAVGHVSAGGLRARGSRRAPPFIHAVRDPLEMCVSAYQYHLHATEPPPGARAAARPRRQATLRQHYTARSPPPRASASSAGARAAAATAALPCSAEPPPPPPRAGEAVWEVLEAALMGHSDAVAAERADAALRGDPTRRRRDGAALRLPRLGPQRPRLLKAAAQFDLARNAPGDAAHVSSDGEKAPLRTSPPTCCSRCPPLGARAPATPTARGARRRRGSGRRPSRSARRRALPDDRRALLPVVHRRRVRRGRSRRCPSAGTIVRGLHVLGVSC